MLISHFYGSQNFSVCSISKKQSDHFMNDVFLPVRQKQWNDF